MGRHPTLSRGATSATLVVAGLLTAACAQSGERLSPTAFAADSGTTGSINPAPTVASKTGGWSGESGESGHPAMTADAIRAAAANFPACIAGLWPDAARRGISRASFERHAAQLTPDMSIVDRLDRQPEFTKSFWDYLDMLVADSRIRRGREVLAKHKPVFDAVEQRYGVDRYIIAAIWGIESNFGIAGGDRPVLRSTATLACIGRRQAYFRDEFLAALEILHHGDIPPDRLKGSWAGAFGATQFMPTAFKRHAVDFDGDGRRDVIASVADALASTANNLHKSGWRSGETWGYEVVVPDGFDYRLAGRAREMTMQAWQRLGIRRAGGKAIPRPNDHGYLLVPAGAQGPAFLMLGNFRVIMRYNPSEAYALAIGHLADRMRGGGPLVQPWPRHERALSRGERLELQQHLARAGFDVGKPDGRLGEKTRAALRAFQLRAGGIPDGFASASVLSRLRRL